MTQRPRAGRPAACVRVAALAHVRTRIGGPRRPAFRRATRRLPNVRVLVVANPRATATSPRERDVLAHALASEAELEVVETENRGHAAALACRAMRNGTDVVVALGGDGTVNEVINGLLTDGVHAGRPGTRHRPGRFDQRLRPRARAAQRPGRGDRRAARGRCAPGARRSVSMGLADDRYFCFAAGLGFDAAIVHGVERKRRLRQALDPHAVRPGRRRASSSGTDRRHPQLHVELPDGTRSTTSTSPSSPTPTRGRSSATARCARPRSVSFETGLAVYARRRMGTAGMLFSMARMSGDAPAGSGGAGRTWPTTWTTSPSSPTSRCPSRSTAMPWIPGRR